jgi:hypothetical protein
VALLPDRSSRILGLAAARFFDLPTREYEPGLRDVLVVAYDLNEVTEDAVASLHERARGQVLFEHATCWTDPPGVSADVSTLLQQRTIAPWEPQLTADGRGEADERPAEVIAADILGAEASADCSVDADADFVAFVRAAAASWLSGPRDRVRSAGPVRSAKFG